MRSRSMADLVKSRLDALGLNPFEAARRAGLEKGFVNDLLIGRKMSVRGKGLYALAGALECDPEYLTGHQQTPRATVGEAKYAMMQPETIPFGGIIEAGTWREVSTISPAREAMPASPDPRFRSDAQAGFLVRGHGASKLGVDDGMIVIGCAVDAFEEASRRVRDGDAVIVQRWRNDRTEMERSIRIISGQVLAPAGDGQTTIPRVSPDADVVAVVVRTIRVFGMTTWTFPARGGLYARARARLP